MPLGLSIAAAALGFASVSAAGLPTTTTIRAGATPPPSPLSARTIQRLRAKGLHPDDPRLSERLAELARSRRRPAVATSKVRFDVTNVKFPTLSIFKYAGSLSNAPATLPSGMGAVFNGLHPKPTIQQVEFSNVLGVPSLDFSGAHLSDGTSYAGTTVSVDTGACGQATLPVGDAANANPQAGTFFRVAGFYVAKDTPATLSVIVSGVRSDPMTVTYPAESLAGIPIFASATLSISDSAPFMIGDGGLGLPKTAFVTTTTADRISTSLAGTTVSGTDTIGYGINLVNGWTATASIQNVHSLLDAPSNTGSNDQFRNATVVQQPQSGRLETKIVWKYEPGESVSYDVFWQFNKGILGTRQVTTQPKQTTCSDEE